MRRLAIGGSLFLAATAGAQSPPDPAVERAPGEGVPREAVAANERGIAELAAGRAARAIPAFRDARRILPGHETVGRNLAAALAAEAEGELQARRGEEAIRLLREARDLHPTRIHYRLLLARAHLALGREADRLHARDELLAVLDADPQHVPALLDLAGIDYVERRLEEGAQRLRDARALRPDDRVVLAKLQQMVREHNVEKSYEKLAGGAVFVVRYAPSIPRERAQSVLSESEAGWSELTNRFGHFPDGRIVVTLYPPADFRQATLHPGWVAGVSDGSIRLTVDDATRNDALGKTIRHELAHHIIRDLAPRTPVWLHEGLAQLAEGRDGARAALRFQVGAAPRDADLDRPILDERDSTRVADFYALSLAFTHHLQQLQGDRGIQRLLQGMQQGRDFDDASHIEFGSRRAELFDAWLRTIRPP